MYRSIHLQINVTITFSYKLEFHFHVDLYYTVYNYIPAGSLEINNLRVRCPNEGAGCRWMKELHGLEKHQKSCQHALVSCPNECKEAGGSEVCTFLRKALKSHIKSKCPKRQYKCPRCQESGEYEERTSRHLNVCPMISTDCPNEGCHKLIPRSSVSSHADICDYQLVPCKYAVVGCEETPLRKDLLEHEEDDKLHLRITTEAVLQQKMTSDKFTFMVPDFNELKLKKTAHKSTPFYMKGYNLKVEVHEGKGQGHVSVFTFLLKGKYDNCLQWPFQGTVTIELLNQLDDKNHYRDIFVFRADYNISKPADSLEQGIGCGRGKTEFISHSALDYNREKNCQYLKNDSLVFRISVDVPDHKPWLMCSTEN